MCLDGGLGGGGGITAVHPQQTQHTLRLAQPAQIGAQHCRAVGTVGAADQGVARMHGGRRWLAAAHHENATHTPVAGLSLVASPANSRRPTGASSSAVMLLGLPTAKKE